MDAKAWAPGEIPLDRPNAARIYDYLLGGYHNFQVDRSAADRLAETNPDVRVSAWVNRAFLRRCVRFLVEQGIDQFLDIGSGIPTVGNVHELVQVVDPSARVVYIDIDPIAVAHGQAMLRDNPNVVAIRADARRPNEIIDHTEVQRLLDWSRPVAVLFVLVLHLLPIDDQAYHTVATLRDALAAGSYVAISHPSYEDAPAAFLQHVNKLTDVAASRYQYRTLAKIRRFFDGLDLIEPGLVHTPLWRPESPQDLLVDEPQRSLCFAGVGLKSL